MYKFHDVINFGDYLYNDRLPAIYRKVDSEPEQDYSLQKYLNAIGASGFASVISDITNFLDLLDPSKCPDKYFPMLFETRGLPFFQDISIGLQRKLLINIGDLYMRKGTKGAIEYLGREMSGLEAKLVDNSSRLFRTWSKKEHKEIPKYVEPHTWSYYYEATYLFGSYFSFENFTIVLEIVDSWADGDENLIDMNEAAFERFIYYFIPFDIGLTILKVMRNTEFYTGFEEGRILNDLSSQTDFTQDERVYISNDDEYAGRLDFAFTRIWEKTQEINKFQTYIDESKTNNKYHIINGTFYTNKWDYKDKVMPT